MKKHDVYREILRGVIHGAMSREEILFVALVLHTHSIVLSRDVEVDGIREEPEAHGITLSPLTRTHVAEMLSSLWPSDDERGRMSYWLTHYCQTVAYELFEDLPDSLRDRANTARDRVMAHDFVEDLFEE